MDGYCEQERYGNGCGWELIVNGPVLCIAPGTYRRQRRGSYAPSEKRELQSENKKKDLLNSIGLIKISNVELIIQVLWCVRGVSQVKSASYRS